MRFVLREYQADAVDRIRGALRKHRRVLFVLPTGGGKTVVFSYIAESASAKGNRVLIVAHRREIVDQISRSLLEMDVRHGLILPGHTMTENPVQVGMVQTIARRLDRVARPNLLVVDEAHHAVAGSWKKLTERLTDAKILGVTATPQRLDGKGLGEAFDTIVEGPQVRDLIGAGHLSAFDYLAPPSQADLSEVATSMGDFDRGQAARIMDSAVITGDAVEHYARHLNGRPAIAFCISVEHAEHVAETFRSRGWRAASVDGTMASETRRDLIGGLARGRLNVLTSCELISEGVDVPVVAGALLLRPTKSLSMYLQQIGRCLRLKPDGCKAIILDHVGNVERHGLPDMPRVWSLAGRDKRDVGPPNRTCPLCFKVVPLAALNASIAACRAGRGASSDCGLLWGSEETGPRSVEHVDGELVRYVDPHAWTLGIDIATARGRDWFTLLDRCDGKAERYEQIAKARGYKRGWIRHVMTERAGGASGGSDFQAREWVGREGEAA